MLDFGNYQYVAWLIIFVGIPSIILYSVYWDYLKKYRKVLVYCTFFSILFGLPWDIWAVSSGMWFYHSEHIVGVWFLGLPLEEHLFLLFVPSLLAAATLVVRKKIVGNKQVG